MGRPTKTINEIVNGKAAITPDTAIQLELALGVAAGFWNNAETAYRAHLARERAEQELGRYHQWAAQFPLKDLARYGLIDKTASQAATVAALLRFFGVSSPEAWHNQWEAAAVSFRAHQPMSHPHTPQRPGCAGVSSSPQRSTPSPTTHATSAPSCKRLDL